MSQAIRSMQVWTVYVFVLGVGLLLVPNLIIGLFGIAETTEVWIRVVGLVVLALGVLYWSMLQREDREGFLATSYRTLACRSRLDRARLHHRTMAVGVVRFCGLHRSNLDVPFAP